MLAHTLRLPLGDCAWHVRIGTHEVERAKGRLRGLAIRHERDHLVAELGEAGLVAKGGHAAPVVTVDRVGGGGEERKRINVHRRWSAVADCPTSAYFPLCDRSSDRCLVQRTASFSKRQTDSSCAYLFFCPAWPLRR